MGGEKAGSDLNSLYCGSRPQEREAQTSCDPSGTHYARRAGPRAQMRIPDASHSLPSSAIHGPCHRKDSPEFS